ncbi:ArdC family protein [Syntrophothermus lipocalidus]|uniref:Antirestriction protein n=1 Tax=Syntrophothermus lipocalidus (strain DSM 12680 / TGB-C1) TaxID=643648 RepID=D7CPY0_SYNLT|nr:zincin-like metallopeptidase domain-containing protein [Syntrophothermus lipocalidus]ADI02758.1 domain of unknown function DUF1738 [Syntrophothermus lipocalidus DSM 12680]
MASVYEIVTDKIIQELEKGVIPWKQPWAGKPFPVNWETQRPYRGVNLLLLPPGGEYATFKKITEAGGRVKKGARSYTVVFWKLLDVEEEGTDGETETKTVPYLRYYRVFEVNTQVEGLRSKQGIGQYNHETKPTAEDIVARMPNSPEIEHFPGSAGYSLKRDAIRIPRLSDFETVEEYYQTLFHELVHSTAHPGRLNRKVGPKGSREYAKEELVAEIGASFLMAEAGLEIPLTNTAGYIDYWLGVLRRDKRLIVEAAGAAQRAVDYILNRQDEILPAKHIA